jgi:hypothetical protein
MKPQTNQSIHNPTNACIKCALVFLNSTVRSLLNMLVGWSVFPFEREQEGIVDYCSPAPFVRIAYCIISYHTLHHAILDCTTA